MKNVVEAVAVRIVGVVRELSTERPVVNDDTDLSSRLAVTVDQLIGELATKARKIGVADSLLRARLRRWLSFEPPARWLLKLSALPPSM